MDSRLALHLAYALTGAEPAASASWGFETVLQPLAELGWSVDEIRAHAAACHLAQEPWPHQVPIAWLKEHGAARWSASLDELVRQLRLDVAPTVRTATRPLTADERRLLADVPPHHGA